MRSRTIKYAPFCERGFFAHFIQILMSADVRLYGDVPKHDANSCGDGITRRSLKLAQRAFAPALASRGALRDLASQTKR